MALVGHISGSTQSQSVIGVTGSVVFSNSTNFPSLSGVGSDVVFFVSGTIGGKGVAGQKTVAVFGGDAVVSGSLTVGTGSIKITSNDIQFGGPGNRIELNGTSLKFFDAANTAGVTLSTMATGGGGGGASYFSSVTAGEVFTTGSIVSSGSITVKNGTGAPIFVAAVDGNVTGSSLRLTGGEVVTTQTTFSLLNSTATTVNFAGAATTLNVGASGGTVAIPGSATVGGGFDGTGITLGSAGALRAKGNLQVNGTAAITGSITLAGAGAQSITHTGAGDLTVSSTSGNVLIEGSTFSGNDLTVPGNLTVNGSVVAIETTNLKVKDPLLLLNSGSAGPNAKSAIAFASGSTTGPNSLIFGALGSANILAAAQMDAKDGAETAGGISYTTPVPIRASEFQARADTAKVTSADGLVLVVTGSTTRIGSNGGVTEFAFANTTLGQITSVGGLTLGSAAGTNLNLSGSNSFVLNHGNNGLDFALHGATYLDITSGSHASAPNAALLVSLAGGMLVGGQGATLISGSQVNANAGNNGFTVQRNGAPFVTLSTPDGLAANITPGGAITSANVFNTGPATVALGGSATTLNIGNSTTSTQTMNIGNASTGSSTYNFAAAATGNGFTRTINLGTGGVAGSTTNINLGNANGGTVTVNNNFALTGKVTTSLLPSADTTYDLGSPLFRWANMYTGDLHLRNDRGDWTIIEEPDFLTITNNRNGKRYKFVMEEIG